VTQYSNIRIDGESLIPKHMKAQRSVSLNNVVKGAESCLRRIPRRTLSPENGKHYLIRTYVKRRSPSGRLEVQHPSQTGAGELPFRAMNELSTTVL
jgi:hypothetical protein